jgi:hypothetical protein
MARESVTLSLNSGCSGRTTSLSDSRTSSTSLARQLALRYDYVWFVPSGAVKEDLSHNAARCLQAKSPPATAWRGKV